MSRFCSSWQYIKKHRIAAIITVFVVVMLLIFAGYWFDWTGFNAYNKVTIAHTISGINAGTVIRTEESQPGKALWDWLQLLFVPVFLAFGALWIAGRQDHAREIAKDVQSEAALQEYINKMSELLIERDLRTSAKDDDVRTIARVLTLTVLPRLAPKRKRSVLLFLHDCKLIDKDKPIIGLHGADLSGADLHGAYQPRAYLSEAELDRANLSGANLSGADLSGANLSGAGLSGANLSGANLKDAKNITAEELEKQAKSLKGAIMLDGKIHP